MYSFGSPAAAAQNLGPAPARYVLTYWFYVASWGSGGHFAAELLSNWDPSAGTANFITQVWWLPPNTMSWTIWRPNAGGGATQTYSRTLSTGSWHLLETVIDATVGRQCLYIDGTLVGSLSVSPASTFAPTVVAFGDISWSGDAGDAYYDDLSILALNTGGVPDYVPVNPQPSGTIDVGLSLPVSLSVQVRNQGSGNATSSAVLAFHNETTPGSPFASFSVPTLVAGASSSPSTAVWRSPSTAGSYRILADVDYAGDVPESNEGNNRYTWTVNVHPPPITSLIVGSPSYAGAVSYVRSSTLLSLSVVDRSGTGIAQTLYRIDGAAWVDYALTGPFMLAVEGEHLVEFYSEDNVGNVESPRSDVLRVDDAPPATSLTIGDPKSLVGGVYVTSATPFALAASDGGVTPVGLASIDYRIDGGPWVSYASPFTLSTAGSHLIEYRSSDLLGNTEAVRSQAVVVDVTGPVGIVRSGSPSYVSADTWVTSATPITIETTDAGSGVATLDYRRWYGGWSSWVAYSGPFTMAGDGRHYIEWRAADRLGNTATGNATFNVDDTAPDAFVSVTGASYAPGGGDTWITSASTVSLASTDGGTLPVGLGALDVRIWHGSWSPWAAYVGPLSIAGEGRHFMEWRATDRLGNTRIGNVSFIVDDTAPISAHSLQGPSFTGTQTFVTSATLIALASGDGGVLPSGLRVLEYSLDGVNWITYLVPLTLQGMDGPKVFYYRGTDRLGNVESPLIATLVLDNTPPASRVVIPSGALSVASQFTVVSGDAGCGLDLIEYSVDGGPWRAYGGPFQLAVGDHTIRYRAVDRLGNAEAESVVSLRIENWKPLVAIAFDVVLAVVGTALALRAPSRSADGRRKVWTPLLVFTAPFVGAEITTGVLSASLGVLTIPPFLDVGTVVDLSLFVAGLAVVVARAARVGTPPAPAD